MHFVGDVVEWSHSLTHCCAWPAEGRSDLHNERSRVANCQALMGRPISSSTCWSQVLRGRPGGRFQSAAGGVPVVEYLTIFDHWIISFCHCCDFNCICVLCMYFSWCLCLCRASIFKVHLRVLKTLLNKDDLARKISALTPGFSGIHFCCIILLL